MRAALGAALDADGTAADVLIALADSPPVFAGRGTTRRGGDIRKPLP